MHSVLLGISTLPPAGGKRTLSNVSTAIENQTFGTNVTKKLLIIIYDIK